MTDYNRLMGQAVQFDKVYQRKSRIMRNGEERIHERTPWDVTKGWVVGFRTIYDGYITCDRDEYGTRQSGDYFVQTGHKECVLICVHPRQNPLKVPLDAIREIR